MPGSSLAVTVTVGGHAAAAAPMAGVVASQASAGSNNEIVQFKPSQLKSGRGAEFAKMIVMPCKPKDRGLLQVERNQEGISRDGLVTPPANPAAVAAVTPACHNVDDQITSSVPSANICGFSSSVETHNRVAIDVALTQTGLGRCELQTRISVETTQTHPSHAFNLSHSVTHVPEVDDSKKWTCFSPAASDSAARQLSLSVSCAHSSSTAHTPLTLPCGWAILGDENGRFYYSNSQLKITQYQHPSIGIVQPAVPIIPSGWEKLQDNQGKTYFGNPKLKICQYTNPSFGIEQLAPQVHIRTCQPRPTIIVCPLTYYAPHNDFIGTMINLLV